MNEMVSSENDTQTCNHIPTEFVNLDKVIYIWYFFSNWLNHCTLVHILKTVIKKKVEIFQDFVIARDRFIFSYVFFFVETENCYNKLILKEKLVH